MRDGLKETFVRYAKPAQLKLQPGGDGRRKLSSLDESVALRWLVEGELEQEPEFRELLARTGEGIRHFLRRSGYYHAAFEGSTPAAEVAFDQYWEARERQQVELTHLAPLELVGFDSAARLMDFGRFQIRRFRADELAGRFQSRICEVFYPAAFLEVGLLEQYWFLSVTEDRRVRRPKPEPGLSYSDWDFGAYVEYTHYPKAIESALRAVALFDWESWSVQETDKEASRDLWWERFRMPLVLSLENSLITAPPRAPDLSVLLTVPIVDPHTGDDTGREEPYRPMWLNRDETTSFEHFVKRTERSLALLEGDRQGWQFLERALGYLLKAFFAEELEQLLWHTATLEALVERHEPQQTKRMRKRVASILGCTQPEKHTVSARFDKVYTARSRLVHGERVCADRGYLYWARSMARQVLLWFVRCLAHIQAAVADGQTARSMATREGILSLLDCKANDGSPLRGLLPCGFPSVQEWLE